MPAKSKHGRGKHRRGKKKGKFRHALAHAGLTRETPADTAKTEVPLNTAPVAKPQVQKRAATSEALPLHYEFIGGDLKRIGILTGIVVVLLIAAYYIFT